MSDICNKIAIKVGDDIPDYRVKKMLDKGWKLKSDFLEIQKYSSDDDLCALCLDNFTQNITIKNPCCKGRLHQKCFKKLINRNCDTCIYCRANIPIGLLDAEFLGR